MDVLKVLDYLIWKLKWHGIDNWSKFEQSRNLKKFIYGNFKELDSLSNMYIMKIVGIFTNTIFMNFGYDFKIQ